MVVRFGRRLFIRLIVLGLVLRRGLVRVRLLLGLRRRLGGIWLVITTTTVSTTLVTTAAVITITTTAAVLILWRVSAGVLSSSLGVISLVSVFVMTGRSRSRHFHHRPRGLFCGGFRIMGGGILVVTRAVTVTGAGRILLRLLLFVGGRLLVMIVQSLGDLSVPFLGVMTAVMIGVMRAGAILQGMSGMNAMSAVAQSVIMSAASPAVANTAAASIAAASIAPVNPAAGNTTPVTASAVTLSALSKTTALLALPTLPWTVAGVAL